MSETATTQKAIVVAGFAGVGKSWLLPSAPQIPSLSAYTFNDLDSTPFSHTHGPLNPAFPANYIAHIKTLLPTPNLVIMIGVHDVVRDQLVAEGIDFTLVYPEKASKEEYVRRWTVRGSPAGLVRKLDEMWEPFTTSCQGQVGCKHVVLKQGQYLADVIEGVVHGEGVQK